MFAAFHAMRNLHELLYYLTEALAVPAARPLRDELRAARDGIGKLADGSAEELIALDVAPLRSGAGDLLARVSDLARAGTGRSRKRDRRGADLIGAVLTGTDLRGANLRGAYLIGADLTGADLRGADLLGTDLRGANLGGADLTGTIFLIQSQLDAARGTEATKLPESRTHPPHWL
jgi:glutathione S-transferase